MSELFSRDIEVIVGPRDKEGRLITGLRMAFKVEKTSEPGPNTAQLQISNLSAETRAIVETNGAYLIIRAGYNGTLKTLFQGNVATVETKISGADLTTTIEAGDGEAEYRNARADISFGPGAKFGQVFNALADKLGLAKGAVSIPNAAEQFLQGYAGTGTVREQLDYLAKKQGLQWSIQDGQLQMLAEAEPAPDEAVLLNSGSGLVGSPFKTKVLRPDLAKGKDAASGLKVMSLLNAELRPGRRIKVESRLVDGVYKTFKVTHQGDTHGPAWYSEVEAK